MWHRLYRTALRALPVVPVLIAGFVASVNAQGVLPPQLSQYLCQNYDAMKTLAPVVALAVMAFALGFGLVRRHSNLVVDIIVGGLIALIIINLPTILTNVGLNSGCS